jgi:hypothetical protein
MPVNAARHVVPRLSCDWLTGSTTKTNNGGGAMSRAEYCIEQARLCRELASQLSSQPDAKRLRDMASAYDAEARELEGQQAEQQQQPKPDEPPKT